MTDTTGNPAMPAEEILRVIELLKRTQHNWFRMGVLCESDLRGALERLERLAALAPDGPDQGGA